jgi:hypothetical protein
MKCLKQIDTARIPHFLVSCSLDLIWTEVVQVVRQLPRLTKEDEDFRSGTIIPK